MEATNIETMEHYFPVLKEILEHHDLVGQPTHIYNVDEYGMLLYPPPLKVVSPKARQSKNQKGWINTELFELWFIEHFIINTVSACPLFLLDGLSTHYQPQVICFAMEHVIMLCLPPHNT